MQIPTHALETLKDSHFQTLKTYLPEFFRLKNENDKKAFIKILETPGLSVIDFIGDQIAELVKFSEPSKKFSTEELILKTNEKLNGMPSEEYGVWVYYPWSRRLVHILDEEEFVLIRTSRNQYKITPEEKEILVKKKIGVIGLSVGQSVSVTLAMERICGELRLADFDILELTNLNRIRTGVHNLGLPKVYSVAREIAEIDPFIKVRCFPDGLHEKNMDQFFTEGGKLDLLVEESDGFDIKILSRYKARELKIPVIMEGSDRCLVDVERFDLEPERSILHGLVDHLDIGLLKTLKTNEQKIPYMLDILGLETSSLRLKASMLEIEQTINTWPQLASAVTMGGGITADVSRRMLLNQFTKSGRYHIDVEELIGEDTKPLIKNNQQPPGALHDVKAIATSYAVQKKEGQVSPSKAEITEIVSAGCKAPSGGNSQPWRWVYKNDCLLLFNGIDGSGTLLGFDHLASYVALGAACENAIIKAGEFKYEARAEFPAIKNSFLVAILRFYNAPASYSSNGIAKAIDLRLTNRKLGARQTIENSLFTKLNAAATVVQGVELNFFTDPKELSAIADLLGELEKIRLLDETGHRDFVNEIRWTTEENDRTCDGIDIRTLDLSASEKVGLEVARDKNIIALLSKWKGGGAFKKLTKKSIESAGAVGILTMSKPSPEKYIQGGRALESVWLTANHEGVAFQPMAASVFIYARLIEGKGVGLNDSTRENLLRLRPVYEQTFKLSGDKREIFIFRLSKASEPEVKSLRKPLEELFYHL